jgi:hypothetical protein
MEGITFEAYTGLTLVLCGEFTVDGRRPIEATYDRHGRASNSSELCFLALYPPKQIPTASPSPS